MKQLNEELRTFVGLFDRMGVPYTVMGGIAVRAHGIPRPTQDLDFTVALERERLPELFAEARLLGYDVPEAHSAGEIDQIVGMPLVHMARNVEGRGIDVDLFLAESRFQQELLKRAKVEEIDDFMVSLVTPEDLILLKLLVRRARDMADVADILFTQGALDEEYLWRWAKILGVSQELEEVLREPPAI